MANYTWSASFTGQREANALASALERLDKILSVFTQTGDRFASSQRKTSSSFRSTAEAAAKTTKEVIKTAEGVSEVVTEFDRFGKVLKTTISELNKTANGTTRTVKVIDALGNTVKESSVNIEDHAKKTGTLSKSYRDAGTSAQGWGKKLIKFLGNFNTLNKAFDFAAKRVRQFGTAVTSVFSFVYNGAGKFEEGAAALRAYGDANGEVAKKASDLAATSRFTSEQAVDAAIELKKAGQSNKEAMESMGPVLTASAANSISLGKAAKIAANGMAQFSKDGTTAKETLEIMTGGAMSATTDITELSSAMKNAAPISSVLGQNITQVTTALAMMAKNGITAGRAGTSWKIAMERLSAPTPAATKSLKALGISLRDIDLSDPASMMEVFRQAIAKIPKESEQIRMLKPIFGRSIGALLPMLKAGRAGFDEMTESVTKNRDAMSNLETEKAKTMEHAYLMMGSAVQKLSITLKDFIGVPITGFLQGAANAINTVSDRLGKFSDGFGEAGMSVEEWFDAVQNGDFSGLFSGLAEEFAPEIEKVKKLIAGLKTLAATWFKELWQSLVDENVIAEVSAFAGRIMNAIFTTENTKKATQFGIDLGMQVIKGFASTTKGKLALGAMAGMGGLKLAGTAMSAYGTAKAVGGALGMGGGASAGGATTGLKAFGAALSKASSSVLAFGAKIGGIAAKALGMGAAFGGAGVAATTGTAVAAVGGAYATGKILEGQIDAWGRTREREETVRGATALSQGIQDLSAKRKATNDPEVKARIDKQIAAMTAELNSIGGTGMIEESRKRAAEEVAAENTVSPEEARRRKNQEMLDQAAIEETAAAIEGSHKAEKAVHPNTPEAPQREKTLSEMSDEELTLRKDELSKQAELSQSSSDITQKTDAANNLTGEAQVEINAQKETIETYLVRPFSKFLEMIDSAKEKFGAMLDSIKNKRIDFAEKFGLKSSEEAGKDRQKVLEDANKRDEKLLETAASPEKQAEIQQRMADRAAQLAESSEGPDKQKYAEEADRMLEDAEKSTEQAEEDEIKRAEIKKKFAEENVGEYEKMLGQSEDAGTRAVISEKLMGLYKDLGESDKLNDLSTKYEEDTMQAAIEQQERARESLEVARASYEQLQRIVAELQGIRNDTGGSIPEDPGYAM